ncbi:hypothetical protein [Macrococcoides caseolyticum]|uniref:Uncharacterized protein n=1 Tax=Macrococcoides caseolyticum TaxID=69966 RepID=A0ACC9MRC0_9STAP|nr:hypothetical protein [Macrococcus caseolyticus]PKE39177.1 hypothetical protein CW675_08000 [Macrococcus caseolyticus]PKE56223.1 hypothetical protein CW682_08280 [Macrococcus caseolyticus]
MDLHMILIHRLLCIFCQNPYKDYTEFLDNMDIINILIDMKLIQLSLKIYISEREYDQKLFIKVTPKGLLFIKSFNNILDNKKT